MKPLRHPAAHVRRLMISPRDSVCAWLFVLAFALPVAAKLGDRAWSIVPPALPLRLLSHGHKRDLSGSLVTPPVPLPCSQTPAEPVILAMAAFPMLPPRPTRRRLRRFHDFEAATGLQYPLSTLHERRCRRPCKTRFRPAGSAFAGRASNPLGHDERFQVTSILLSRTCPDASWVHARRPFFIMADIAANARRKAQGKTPGVISPLALEAVRRIDALFDDRTLDQRPERRAAAGGPSGAERAAGRRSGTLAARAAGQAVARQRSRQGDGLHAQALAGVHPLPR